MQLIEFFFQLTANLAIVLNPILIVSAFIGIVGEAPQAQQRALAARSCLISLGIGSVFAVFGMQLLSGAGITTAALRIAGGVLLFRSGAGFVSSSDESSDASGSTGNILRFAVFPLAFPIIIGPGVLCIIASACSSLTDPSWIYSLAAVISIILVIGINFAFLWVAPQLFKILGKSAVELMKRLVGLFLTMLAVQIIIAGATEVHHSWKSSEVVASQTIKNSACA